MHYGKIIFQVLLFLAFSHQGHSQEASPVPLNKVFYASELNYTSMCNSHASYSVYPRSLNTDGTVRKVQTWDWTSGFFPGGLWYLYENTGNSFFKQNAVNRTAPIADQRFNTGTHDLGFMLYCSFGNGLRITDSAAYASVLLDAANSLYSRFNPIVGCIRSWDFGSWDFPVIIDNMMNLELLFWATNYTGDSAYYHAAVSHAQKTIDNHFRGDNSSYHVVDYNPATGEVIGKSTHQGYSDESHWARGQAWGLYGYTMCYKETGEEAILSQAEKIANYYISHPNMAEDNIPYWDFLAPGIPNEPRDVSAAAIAASALLELSQYSESGDVYFDFAEQTLTTLSGQDYFAFENKENGFLLKQSTGSKPSNSEVSTPIIYADYYFLEALSRYRNVCDKTFEPYIETTESIVVSSGETTADPIHIYTLENATYSLSIENDPGFIQITETEANHFTLILSPGSDESGIYDISLVLTSDSGEKSYLTKHVYVEKNSFPDLIVNASQTVNNNLAEYTLDGNFNTCWESDVMGSWLIYDLGNEFLIDSLRMAFSLGETRKYAFSAFSSLNAIDWNIELYAESSGKDSGFENFGFREPRRLRYVKIIGYGSDIDQQNAYAEVRFVTKEQNLATLAPTADDIVLEYFIVNNHLDIRSSIENQIVSIEVYNLKGSRILSSDVDGPAGQISLPLSSLGKGIYLACVFLESGASKTLKFFR